MVISGLAEGKDTVGNIIRYLEAKECVFIDPEYKLEDFLENSDKVWSPFAIKKFAGKLKEIASILTGIPVEKFEDQEFKKTFLGPEWDRISDNASMDDIMLWGRTPMTVREFLQKLGTEGIREGVHSEAWVNALFADYKPWKSANEGVLQQGASYITLEDHKEKNYYKTFTPETRPEMFHDVYPSWILTDTRFPNEAQAIKDRGGIVIRINRYPKKILICRANNDCYEVDFDSSNQTHLDWYYGESIKKHESETSLDNWEFDYILDNNGTLEELVEKVDIMLKHFKI